MSRPLRAILFVTIMAVLSCPLVLAGPPQWTYLEAGFLNVDPDDLEAGDSAFAGASLGFLKNFHVNGRYVDGDYTNDASLTYWQFGAGWHGGLGEKADLVAEARWVDTEIEDFSSDGMGLTGGVRWKPVEFFELDGFVNWVDYDDDSVDSYEVRAIFDVWRIGIGAAAELESDVNQYSAFVRFNFGEKK